MLRCRRLGNLPRRRRFHFGILPAAQAGDSGTVAQCGRRPPNQKRTGPCRQDAAIYVKDAEAKEKLLSVALETVKDNEKLKALSNNIAKLALPDSATVIAKEVLKLIK